MYCHEGVRGMESVFTFAADIRRITVRESEREGGRERGRQGGREAGRERGRES